MRLDLTLVLASRKVVVAAVAVVLGDHLDSTGVLRLTVLVSTLLVFPTLGFCNVEPSKVLLGNLCLRGLGN